MSGFVLVAKCGCALKKNIIDGDRWMHVSDAGAPTVWSCPKAAEIAHQHASTTKVHTLAEWNTGNIGNLRCGDVHV